MKISASKMAKKSAQAEEFLRELANARRLMVLCLLLEGELSVGELNDKIALSQSALSQHLARLRDAGFVTTRRESQTIYYALADANVKTVMETLYGIFCAE
mgnify:CR=1 FL=1|tara:strand:+ start:86908 stop:87210 length:303 start_codon:yes stop_codon:yes gene_type:complete